MAIFLAERNGSIEPRPLTADELAAYSRLAENLLPAEATIVREQLARATILEHDDQHATFFLKGPVRPLRFEQSQALSGSYDDADGWPIDMVVHAACGLLESVERYRTDAGPIQDKRVPLPARIRLTPTKDQMTNESER